MADEIKTITSVEPIELKSAILNSNNDYDEGIFGLSVRGILTSIIVLTVCGLAICKIPIDETLKAALFITLGFYFGTKK